MAKVKLSLQDTPVTEKLANTRLLLEKLGKQTAGYAKTKARAADLKGAADTLDGLLTQRAGFQAQADAFNAPIKTAEAGLDKELTGTGNAAEEDTNGNADALHAIGLQTRADAGGPSAPLPKVTGVSATDGDGHTEVDLAWNAVRESSKRNYRVRYCMDINHPVWLFWEEQPTRSLCTVKNLQTGQQYWFAVQVLGVGDPGEWSDPVPATPV